MGRVSDDDGVFQDFMNFFNAPFVNRLGFFGRVEFSVFRKIALFFGFFDSMSYLRTQSGAVILVSVFQDLLC